jgi:hypothetical protein
MNKFDLMNKVLMSELSAPDKCLLNELILRADDNGECWPSVQRLCKARGIQHEKNFKGADHYLPGLVTKRKQGRKNVYVLDTPALEGLLEAEVAIKHTANTPAPEGVSVDNNTPAVEANTPATEGVYTPATADNTPSQEGANSSIDTTRDSSEKETVSADAPTVEIPSDEGLEEGHSPSNTFKTHWVLLSTDEKNYFESAIDNPDLLKQAVVYYRTARLPANGWRYKAEKALQHVGVHKEEDDW